MNDLARVVYWSVYLTIGVPTCLYWTLNFFKHKSDAAIRARNPHLTIIAFAVYPIASVSLAIGEIIPNYPCCISVWQDFAITYVTFLIYITKGFVHYFQYEWVHERLMFFKKMQPNLSNSKSNLLKIRRMETKENMFFHQHRHWINPRNLMKTIFVIICIGIPFPLYASILMVDNTQSFDRVDNCDQFGWNYFVSGTSIFFFAVVLLLVFKARKAYDIYDTRKDLKYSAFIAVSAYIARFILSITDQFGISTRISIAPIVSSICCFSLSYIGAYRPVRNLPLENIENDESEKKNAENPKIFDYSGITASRLVETARFKPFFDFINNPVNFASFQNFLLKAFAIENFCFVQAVLDFEQFKNQLMKEVPKMTKDELKFNLLEPILQIYHQFIQIESILWVNVSHQCKTRFEKAFSAALKDGVFKFEGNHTEFFQRYPQLSEFSLEDLQCIYSPAFKEVATILVDDLFLKYQRLPEFAEHNSMKVVRVWVADGKTFNANSNSDVACNSRHRLSFTETKMRRSFTIPGSNDQNSLVANLSALQQAIPRGSLSDNASQSRSSSHPSSEEGDILKPFKSTLAVL